MFFEKQYCKVSSYENPKGIKFGNAIFDWSYLCLIYGINQWSDQQAANPYLVIPEQPVESQNVCIRNERHGVGLALIERLVVGSDLRNMMS